MHIFDVLYTRWFKYDRDCLCVNLATSVQVIFEPTCISCYFSTAAVVTRTQRRTQEFCSGGIQQIRLRTEDRENGDLGTVAPLVRGSGGSCNLVQEIPFHIVKFS